MQIEVVGRTTTDFAAIDRYMEVDRDSEHMEDLIEFAGRACYQSFNKPNKATRSNKDYIANILAQQHESVLEHSSVSFYVQGVSRNMLLELERHRHLSFSVVSQRFVDSSDVQYVIPPALRGLDGNSNHHFHLQPAMRDRIAKAIQNAREAYGSIEEVLHDLPRKQRREAARSILPGGVETKFVVTGNLRAWRDVLKKRYSTHADAEIRLFAEEVLQLLKVEAPNVFQDFPDMPFD